MKKFFLFCCIALLCACAKQPQTTEESDTRLMLEQRWQHFVAMNTPKAPYRLHMSLRFGTEGNTRRVTALFWGNSEKRLRLDVMAGVGATMAKILEEGQHFLVYSPGKNKAYFYQGEAKPLLQVGVPVPFTLAHLADLLTGRYAGVFGTTHAQAHMKNGKACYDLLGSPGGTVTLNATGLPVVWQEHPGGKGWRMEIFYSDETQSLPSRLNLKHDNGNQAILLLKQRESPAPFTDEQMALHLPKGTPLLPLSQFKKQ